MARWGFGSVTLPYCGFADLAVQIVDDDSAAVGHSDQIKQWLPANHLDMCKFDDRNSVSYKRVAGAIVELIHDTLDGLADSEIGMCTALYSFAFVPGMIFFILSGSVLAPFRTISVQTALF